MTQKTILVVEDDVDIREALTALLADRGYVVNACANGLEALTQLRKDPHTDVILLDLMMPVMDGWQFRVLQKRDPQLASIPVLAISANGTPKAAAIDADVYLQKPIDFDALLGAIERTLLLVERRRLQAALAETERLAALGTLAAGVAHEINNPLAYVTTNVTYAARVLSRDNPSPREKSEAHTALAEAEEGCNRIRTIVRDLQLFARAPDEQGRPIDVRRVLDSSVSVATHELRSRARVVKDYAEDVPAVVASEGRLGQVFVNLIVNAAQAIREGAAETNEIRLVVRAEDSRVTIEVRDTGEGIPAEIRGRIFEPFFTTKPVGVGTGLGLSIVRKLVEAAGGDIGVESEPGKGSVFRVRLPASGAVASDAPPSPRSSSTEPTARPVAERARVLVIDDEERICKMLVRALRDAFDVDATTDPASAIERVGRGERFDAILCDMMMPGKTGIDVHAAVAAAAPEQAARMLFMTGDATSARYKEFLARQASAVIEKPFVASQLIARIDAMLSSFEKERLLAAVNG